MGSFGLNYNEFLESCVDPDNAKYRDRYKKSKPPAAIKKEDGDVIRTFLDEAVGNGLTQASAKTSASYLAGVSRHCPGLATIDTKQASAAFSHIRENMKPNSARRAMSIFKGFVYWMNDEKINCNIDLAKIKKIKFPKPATDTKQASNMLDGKEISLLIETSGNDRDKALIAMMFEGSLRPIEVISARWEDLNFDKHGAQFSTSKKTGIPRYIRLIMSAPYLLKWKNAYPGKITNDSSIFVSLNEPHRPIGRAALKSLFDTLVKKTGIKKSVTPYDLRHSRITSMIADEIPDSVVKLQAWGSLKSNMLATYAHLQNSDVDRILLSRAGIITEESKHKDESLKPRQCSNCGKIHAPTTKFCDDCGAGLTEDAKKTRVESVAISDSIMINRSQDANFIDAVARRMLEIQGSKQ